MSSMKRTIYLGNPAYLQKKNFQLQINYPKEDERPSPIIPIEDIGILVLDNPQITMSHALMQALLVQNIAVLSCNESHLPTGMFLHLDSNTLQTERFNYQINASEALKKQLWKQTIEDKIKNQKTVLKYVGKNTKKMDYWQRTVLSGDTKNNEARAAAYYWSQVFDDENFRRDRHGEPPNNMLNYGYAILRAAVARALAGSGLLCTLGIYHKNRYNSFCLADDIMEPYRPFVDFAVLKHIDEFGYPNTFLEKEEKATMLSIMQLDTQFDKSISPLMVAIEKTTASLYQCFEGSRRKILYPNLPLLNDNKA